MDLGSTGNKYTWRDSMSHGLIIYERVDRMSSNDLWRLQFPYARVKLLTRLDFFDHHHVYVSVFKI